MNLENKFMILYGLSHNQRWGFYEVDDDIKLEELTVHSYDIRLKEKCIIRSIKDVILVDLQENNLHSLNAYIKTIEIIINILFITQYIQNTGRNQKNRTCENWPKISLNSANYQKLA